MTLMKALLMGWWRKMPALGGERVETHLWTNILRTFAVKGEHINDEVLAWDCRIKRGFF